MHGMHSSPAPAHVGGTAAVYQEPLHASPGARRVWPPRAPHLQSLCGGHQELRPFGPQQSLQDSQGPP